MKRKTVDIISVRALRTVQGKGTEVFSFFMPGADITRVADISRVERDDNDHLKGFQRKEIQHHVKGIVDYLDQGNVLFPNAIILALSPDAKFKQSRGPSPKGIADFSQIGTLEIPIRKEGKRVAWIVDGQQRSLALSRTQNSDINVPVVGFISADLETQRQQFILVNKAKPLPVRLINELLPEIGIELPRDLSARKIPSELCSALDRDPKSPFYQLIRRVSKEDKGEGVIVDTAMMNVVRRSMNNPLGALSLYRGNHASPSDIEGMYRTLCLFWSAVRDEFRGAWGKQPTESRLMHSAGIQAVGLLMDRIMTRANGSPDPDTEIREALKRIAPYCCWTKGTWDGLGLKWNEVQNVAPHIRKLADHLVKLDFIHSQRVA